MPEKSFLEFIYKNKAFLHSEYVVAMKTKNKIAQGDVYILSTHLTFFKILIFFAILTGYDASNRLNMITFAISRSISVEIDTSFALFKKD